jgi:DNA-binding NarL/FixJ family response regulator
MADHIVLIVEDDLLAARSISRVIQRSVDVELLCVAIEDAATAAAIGIDYLYDHHPSVVIVDGLDGHAVEVLLAASDLEIPAILYTGMPETWRYSEVPVYGKPDYEALLSAITKHIGEQKS